MPLLQARRALLKRPAIVAAGGGLSWTFPASNGAALGGTFPYTTPSLSIGTASSDRFVVACVSWVAAAGGTNGDIASLQITPSGGAATNMTQAIESYNGGDQRGIAIYFLNVTTTTSATFTLNLNGGNGFLNYGSVAAGYFTGSGSATNNAGDNATPLAWGTTYSFSSAVTIPANGLGVFCVGGDTNGSGPNNSWTNATKDFDTFVNSNWGNGVAHATASATVSDTLNNYNGFASAIMAAFQP